MSELVNVTTQAELDAAVEAGNIPVCRHGFFSAYGSATVHAYDSATVSASDSVTVHASGSATVRAFGSATVSAYGSATVRAFGSATVRAYGSATVRASGSVTVHAYSSATVHASGSATVHAYVSATVHAYDSATVHAYDSVTVHASDSVTVRASGSATVSAYGSATVTATPHVAVHKHHKTARVTGGVIIEPPDLTTTDNWLAHYGIKPARGHVTLCKLVDDKYQSGHGASYRPGETTTAPDWKPTDACGNGLHFSPRPFMAHKHSDGSRYVACRVKVSEIVAITDGCGQSDKVKAPSCKVLFECDADGEKLAETAGVRS